MEVNRLFGTSFTTMDAFQVLTGLYDKTGSHTSPFYLRRRLLFKQLDLNFFTFKEKKRTYLQ